MRLIITTKAEATIEEQWVVEVSDEIDHTSDAGFAALADTFFDVLADADQVTRNFKIESHGTVGQPNIHAREVLAIEGPES